MLSRKNRTIHADDDESQRFLDPESIDKGGRKGKQPRLRTVLGREVVRLLKWAVIVTCAFTGALFLRDAIVSRL